MLLSFTQILENLDKLKSLPWKGILFTVTSSFILASVSSTLISQLIPISPKTISSRKASRSPAVAMKPSQFNDSKVKTIIDRNIFNPEGTTGEEVEKPDEVQERGPGAVKSTLAIKLLGIIYGGDPFSGIAVIEDTKKRSKNSFMVGDDVVPKVAQLKEIRRDRIIILREGRLEFVELEKPKLVRSKRRKKGQKATKSPGLAPIATAPPPETYSEPGFDRKGSTVVMTEDYKRNLLSDLPKILQDAKAEPNYVDGELVGFKLTRIRMGSIYEKAGLRNNDVVLEINGTPLTDTAQAIKLLNSLRKEREIEVRLRRGGDIVNVQLDVR